ncbi:MAG: hypothetical protein KatS3mg119_1939 [Rhodothalassiaceae bacterium]|nr:MAG: hypothetical protein KatS3mg119_1939 [Rhodothalassiaceae bacterium]
MKIRYAPSEEGWSSFEERAYELIRSYGANRILEVGGGANPTFTLDMIRRLGLDYHVLDISEEELNKAPDGYQKIVADICKYKSDDKKYDFIFSKMLAEHVPDGKAFHKNIYNLLSSGGVAFHFFPTLYAFPFVVNKLIPEALSQSILSIVQPRRPRDTKFRAYYSWCYGPTKRQISRLRGIGYEIVEYTGYFGHEGYYNRFPVILNVHKKIVGYLLQSEIPQLTSFAQVILMRP